VGTTNREEFLKDDTGNRRFWPVEVGEVDVVGLQGVRDLLFAEAMEAYKGGELLWSGIDETFKNSLKIMHEQFEVTDESENEVVKALSEIELECGKLPFTLIELYEKMNPLSNRGTDSVTLATSHRLGRILRKHGFERKTFVDEKSKKRTKKWFFEENEKKAQKTVKNDPKVTVVTDKVTVDQIGVTEDVGF
jgi:predicted P-loop ATPase